MFVFPDDTDLATRQSFAQLYDQYYKLVYHVVIKILKNEHAAEDALQETFSRAIPYIVVSAEYLDEDGTLKNMESSKQKSYLCAIARNYALDQLDKRSAKVYNEDYDPDPISISDSVLQQIINDDGYQRLLDHIQNLGPKSRDVMMLKFVHGYSNTEIADMLHIPKKNVEMRILRGKKALKKRLMEGSEKDDQ